MDSHHHHHVCLDIPVPRCLQRLPCTPPVCFSTMGDLMALELLSDFGKEFTRSTDEIAQACNLASGPSDLIIILERPNKLHKYGLRFQQFVDQCPTLWAVDELIRLATNGPRSIH